MKRGLLLTALLSLALISCEEQKYFLLESDSSDCFEVTVIDALCAHAILKIEDHRFYHYGETTEMFTNSFLANLPCSGLQTEARSSDDKIFVKISSKPFPDEKNDCVQCLAMLTYDGEKQYYVKFVSKCRNPQVTD